MAVTILIVDDDLEFTASTRDILEAQGYQVISAPKGSEGFARATKEKPDLILLDVMIEDAGAGLDTARKLRDEKRTSKIPVVLLTGIRRADQLLASYAPGEPWPNVKAALEKPVDPEFFIKTIKEVLR
jgi:CheY-like chemotaxis protein